MPETERLLVNPVRPERNQSLSAEFQSDCYTAATSAVDSAELTSTAELGTKRGSNYDEVQGGWSVSHKKIKPQASDGEEARNAVVTILSLPTELHRLIFSSIDDMVDVVSLGINKDPAFKCIRSQLECTKNTYFPQDQQWILRNLTTKQIVRSAAIALSPDDIHGPSIDILGFGDAVMSRIFWSTDSYGGMEYDPTNLTRGTWAGYCFDTTTLSRHEAETCEAEWSDASKREISWPKKAEKWRGSYAVYSMKHAWSHIAYGKDRSDLRSARERYTRRNPVLYNNTVHLQASPPSGNLLVSSDSDQELDTTALWQDLRSVTRTARIRDIGKSKALKYA
ncbi:hypothetical protein CHU98_g5807 [Xylaria longipes]|nr:hypothetical protein CHU98_g5807 [Xylaria longipes]